MNDFVVIDTTSFHPKWRKSNGEVGDIWPTFCLPFFSGEPALTNKEAQLHRRHTKLDSLSTEEKISADDNLSRWHLGDGWMRANKDPDSIKESGASFSWSPPSLFPSLREGERSPSSVECTFVSILKDIVDEINVENVCLIIPSGLGPGPVGEIYNELRHKYKKILLMPRDLAAAAQWAEQSSPGPSNLSPGDEYGDLLVTSFTPDETEQSLVRFHVEQDGTLCPIHDRTEYSTELGMPGMPWILQGEGSAWREQPYPDFSTNPINASNREYLEGRLSLAQGYLFEYDRFSEELNEGLADYITDEEIPQENLKAMVHNGPLIQDELPPYQRGTLRGINTDISLASEDLALNGGYVAMTKFMEGKTPYYQRVTPLHLKVNKQDKFFDTTVSWPNLLDGCGANALLPAGKTFQTPKPITSLSVQANLDDNVLKVDIRVSENRKQKEKRIYIQIEEDVKEAIPLNVKAEINPGTGLAKIKFQAQSSPTDFDETVDENEGVEMPDNVERITHKWPPKSACVIPVVDRATRQGGSRADTIGVMEEFIQDPGRNPLASRHPLFPGHLFNSWKAPYEYNALLGHIPDDFKNNKEWLYLGAFPSHNTTVNDAEMRDVHQRFLRTLEDQVARAENDLRRNYLCRVASWTYRSCPSNALEYAKNRIEGYIERGDTELHQGVLSIAGNCFESDADCKLFFKSFIKHVKSNHVGEGRWADPMSGHSIEYIRTYRNLTRFRANALQKHLLPVEDQEEILNWISQALNELIIFGEQPGNITPKHSVNYIARLAPHLLKRRRFDSSFLSNEDDATYKRFEKAMEYVAFSQDQSFFRTTINSAEISLKFLRNTATDQDVSNFIMRDA